MRALRESPARGTVFRSILLVAMAALVPAWGSVGRTPEAVVPWGMAAEIESQGGSGYDPQVAVDSAGNATAVWDQQRTAGSSIMANRYEVGVGWSTPVFIEPDGDEDALVPQVAVDSNGNVTVVWAEYTSGVSSIWSNRYEAGVGWGAAMLIESQGGSGYDPQVAVDSAGNVTAVWDQPRTAGSSIMANRYEVGVGWSTPVFIEPDGDEDALVPQVAVDSNGNATVVWAEYTSGVSSIWSNLFEFTPLVVSLPDPTGLAQFLADGTTPLSTGGTANGPVFLNATTDNPGGATRMLLVEVRPTAQPFSGDPVRAGATSTTDALTVGFSSPNSASYHWRARVFEPDTRTISNWVAFGGNDDPMDPTDPNGATDFDVELGVGGPDAFGYTYADDRAPNGPVYATEFEEITATGTAITFQTYSSWPANDEGQFEAPFGFSFTFYGNTYTTTWVNTNGFVKFGSSTVSGTNGELAYQATTLPSTQQPNIIAVKWGDRTGVLGWYETRGTAPDRRFIVHWTSGSQVYQVKLYENGEIVLVHVAGNTGGETAGIQNDAGTIGLLYSFNGTPETITNNRSIRFVPPPAPPPPAPVPTSSGGSSGRCGSVGLDLMAPLVLLSLWRRFKRRGRRGLPQ